MPVKNPEAVKALVEQAWWAGIASVNGYQLVKTELNGPGCIQPSHVLAVGKAASSMMLAAYDCFAGSFKGLMVTKYGHIDSRLAGQSSIEIIEAAHPRPDNNSLLAGERAFEFINQMNTGDQLLMLVSGGASSLVEKLNDNLSLESLQAMTDKMLATNNTISQINAARSQISMIKKGKLLNHCKAKSILTYAISDVQGDDIYIIGSGIGACDLDHSNFKIIGSNEVARQAISDYFIDHGVTVITNQESLYGDVFVVANDLANTLINGCAGAYIFGGESVINLPQVPGKGGRNQSLALSIAKHLQNHPGIQVLVAGSDGTDGPTNAAGGMVDYKTFKTQNTAQKALDKANAYPYLEQVNGLFISGPTGTNVMDLAVAIKKV